MDLSMHRSWILLSKIEKITGYWLDQNKLMNYCLRITNILLLSSILCGLALRLYQELGKNIYIVLENIMATLLVSCVIIKSISPLFFLKKKKIQYERVIVDWKRIVDKKEKKALIEQSELGYKMSIVYISLASLTSLPVVESVSSYLLKNGTSGFVKKYPLYVDFLVDQEKYFYHMMIHLVFTCLFGLAASAVHDVPFMILTQHVCAMFKITTIRIESTSEVIRKAEDGEISFEKADVIIYNKIVSAIKLHNVALKKVIQVEDFYSKSWLGVLVENTVGFGVTMAAIAASIHHPFELMRFVSSFNAILIHFYLVYFPGQQIIDYSSSVFDSCYNCDWYKFSKDSKILLRIIMYRSQRCCVYTGGNLFVLCMETYARMLKVGMSYFTLFATNPRAGE